MFSSHNARDRRILTHCLAAYFISGSAYILLGSLAPYLRAEYGLGYETTGLLISAQSMGYLAANFLWMFLPRLIGRKKSVLGQAVWLSVGNLLILLTGAVPALVVACFCIGLSRGVITLFGNVTLPMLEEENPAGILNMGHGAYAMGSFLSPLVLLAFVSWREDLWWATSVIILVLGIVQVVLLLTIDWSRIDPGPVRGPRTREFGVFRSRTYWCATAIILFYVASEYAINGWLVSYLRDSGLLPVNLAQMMSAILWLLMLAGRITVVAVGRRLRGPVTLVLSAIGFVLFFLLVLLSETPALVVLGVMGMGYFMAPIYPTALGGITGEIGGNDLAMGILVTVGGLGGILMPYVVGFVSERSGIAGGMALVLIAVGLMAAAIFVNAALRRREHTA